MMVTSVSGLLTYEQTSLLAINIGLRCTEEKCDGHDESSDLLVDSYSP